MNKITRNELEKLNRELEERFKLREDIIIEIQNTLDPGHRFPSNIALVKQDKNENRIKVIEHLLKNVEIREGSFESDIVSVGAVVDLQIGNNLKTFEIMTKEKMEVIEKNEGFLSEDSPVGRAIINKNVGDIIEVDLPRGKVKVKILKIY